MHSFEAGSRINAEPSTVWTVLIDAAAWPSWDSGVQGVDGAIVAGSKLTIRSAVAPGRAFPVKVTRFEAPRVLEFSGGMPLGLFVGVRTYTLSSDGAGTTFHMREEYSGPMAGMIWRSIPDLQPSFEQFANGLKQRVESANVSGV